LVIGAASYAFPSGDPEKALLAGAVFAKILPAQCGPDEYWTIIGVDLTSARGLNEDG
jgi:hypothetical protein